MNIEDKVFLVKRKPTEELLTEDELVKLFETEEHPLHYIGFEISGMMHIGSALITAMKIDDFIRAGIRPIIWLADYHTWINKKLGGDLSLIREVARGYFKAGFVSLGLDESKVKYELASEHYDQWYWVKVIETMKSVSVDRMLRCITIMGRKESEANEAATVLYPAMQAADIFHLKVQIMHGGMDQRKVHVLVREIAERMKWPKPIAVHNHLLMGLQGPQKMGFESSERLDMEVSSKMSKSIPKSSIFVHDSEEEIKDKINKAYCPEKQIEGNPVLEMCEYLVMRDRPLHIERKKKYGGDVDYPEFAEVRDAYAKGELHPTDLKDAVAKELSEILKPSREYFKNHSELLDVFKQGKVTR